MRSLCFLLSFQNISTEKNEPSWMIIEAGYCMKFRNDKNI